MTGPRLIGWLFLLATVSPVASVHAQTCIGIDGFETLDFWVGEWNVFVGEQQVGTNRIEKILEGCAIIENWTDAEGNEGKSLFYYHPVTETWKQVWVTAYAATQPWGLKEKQLIERFPDGGTLFQGEILTADGSSYLDRTTLTPHDDGTVRQLIERSTDGGSTWEAGFDAIYRRATID